MLVRAAPAALYYIYNIYISPRLLRLGRLQLLVGDAQHVARPAAAAAPSASLPPRSPGMARLCGFDRGRRNGPVRVSVHRRRLVAARRIPGVLLRRVRRLRLSVRRRGGGRRLGVRRRFSVRGGRRRSRVGGRRACFRVCRWFQLDAGQLRLRRPVRSLFACSAREAALVCL